MAGRAVVLAVLIALMTTTLAGFECLWDCRPVAPAGHCHEDATADPALGAAHECRTHQTDAAPATLTNRLDPAGPVVPGSLADGLRAGPATAPADRDRYRLAVRPVRFLPPLRQ